LVAKNAFALSAIRLFSALGGFLEAKRMSVIQVVSLRKTYGPVMAVNGVSLEIQPGEIFGMVGPNGAGKTTTIECIKGLSRPDGG